MTGDELTDVIEALMHEMAAALDERLCEIVHEEVHHVLAAHGVI